MIKFFFIIAFLAFSYNQSKAQQLPHYSLYMFNDVIVNPSRTVIDSNNNISFIIRDQWVGFDGAPTTQTIIYNHLTDSLYKGGISIMNDITGPISIINANIYGAYAFNFKNNKKIGVGLSASLMQYTIDNTQITLENDGILDPAMSNLIEKVDGNGLDISTSYFSDKFYLGFAIKNFISSSLDFGSNKNINNLEKHYHIHSSYKIDFDKNYFFQPSIMLNKIGALPIQLDMNIRANYNNLIWSGISYRFKDALVTLFGINFGPSTLAYSYDITTSSLAKPSSGTHSLFFSYEFKKRLRDRDNDGVIDKEDECPKTPGIVSLRGCPDMDKDGITDLEDDCPKDYGLKINKGCPDLDGDGIVDKKDSCINLAGIKKYDGCPDTDGDGLQDKYDDCPREYGSITNNGCPRKKSVDTVYITKTIIDTVFISSKESKYLSTEFKNIQFDHNKYFLKENSKEILDRVFLFLKNKIELRIRIEGHTDNVDSDEFNMVLSKKRVEEVKKYLVLKGIDSNRIEVSWKGESKPIVENSSSKNRAINRRVEVRIVK